MKKAWFGRLFGRKPQESDMETMLRERREERRRLGERIDLLRAEMEEVVQAGVGLEGNAARLNRERYQALSSRVQSDQRCFELLTGSIAQMQLLANMDSEYRQVEQLESLSRGCGDPDAMERRQDVIDLRTEQIARRNERLAGLEARRGLSADGDDYARRVAEARAAMAQAAAPTVPAAESVKPPAAMLAMEYDEMPEKGA